MQRYRIEDEAKFTKQDVNHLNLGIVNSITGVYNFEIMDCYGCKLFLFGDSHTVTNNGFIGQNNRSLYLPLYLDALFKKYPRTQFDVMLEAPISELGISSYNFLDSVIFSIIKQFNVCYKGISNKVECSKEWPNVRFHNTDIRGILDAKNNYNFINYLQRIQYYENYFNNMINELSANNKDNEQLEHIFDLIVNNYMYSLYLGDLDNYVDNIFELMRTDKKFSKYQNIEILPVIEDFTRDQLNNLIISYEFDKIIDNINKVPIITTDMIIDLLKKLLDLFLDIGVYLMDYYSFIRFEKIKKYGGRNIIIIEGDIHIQNFKNFARTLDPEATMILGTEYIYDNVYEWYYYILDYVNYENVNDRIKLDPRFMYNTLIKISTKYDISTWDADLLTHFNNIIILLENIINEDNQKKLYCLHNPESRIFKISSSEIENLLL